MGVWQTIEAVCVVIGVDVDVDVCVRAYNRGRVCPNH